MSVCTTIFWSIIIPIVTYSSELWILQPDETEVLRKFQRYICRKYQRFPPRSPNYSTSCPLGWIDIDRYIKVKKATIFRTITVMPEDASCKHIMSLRAEEFHNDPMKGNRNEHGSPLLEIFKVCKEFGMLDICLRMARNGCHLSKTDRKNMIWEKAWQLQDNECTPENNYT